MYREVDILNSSYLQMSLTYQPILWHGIVAVYAHNFLCYCFLIYCFHNIKDGCVLKAHTEPCEQLNT